MKRLLMTTISILTLLSCFAKGPSMPSRPLVKVSYRYGSQMSIYPEIKYTLHKDENGIYIIWFETNKRKLCRYNINDASLFEKITEVIRTHKMYKYKGQYTDPRVLDGISWSFTAQFNDSTSSYKTYDEDHISSGGSNKWPDDNGMQVISEIVKKAMLTARFEYVCNEDGKEIPDVTYNMLHNNETVDYLYLFRNEYDGRLDVKFHDLDESKMFKEQFGDVTIENKYVTIKTKSERTYGAIVLDDGTGPIIYAIVDNGAVESVPVAEIVRGNLKMTRISKNKDLVEVSLDENNKLVGLNKKGVKEIFKWDE